MNAKHLSELFATINRSYLATEQDSLEYLIENLQGYEPNNIRSRAEKLVCAVRKRKNQQSIFAAFLQEYQLNSEEGIVLLEIAEALLRIPDAHTQDLLLQEKLSVADWQEHLNHSDSVGVNLATHVLLLTGKVEKQFLPLDQKRQLLQKLFSRLGLSVIRTVIKQAMNQLACHFVIAESIDEAIESRQRDYLYSFDMLGEAALTESDSEYYFQRYLEAIDSIAGLADGHDLVTGSGISIKLSALYPRYEVLQWHTARKELSARLLYLARQAKRANIILTVDAEESDRLQLSLEIFADVFLHPDLQNWQGLGLAVQAYQKRAIHVLRWLAALAESRQCSIPLRLVKGAYWDTEIKRAQENGLSNYPVFTHKTATDVSYLACAKFILSKNDAFYPQFATHNAHTVAAIQELAKQHKGYEFQRLHGMGEQLYAELLAADNGRIPCRVYAPVGNYHDLLPYLVRRLLENGANTSFINQIENLDISIEELLKDPVSTLQNHPPPEADNIALPADLYGKQRKNSQGININDQACLQHLQQELRHLSRRTWDAFPVVNGQNYQGKKYPVRNPADTRDVVGHVVLSDLSTIQNALAGAAQAFSRWRLCPVATRVDCLLKTAELLESQRMELVSLIMREAGRTLKDALAEVREAVDFCRYYGQNSQDLFAQPQSLSGPTGEENLLFYYGRGVFVCISPWNFPLAIFIGQISAALAAGNTVIAKPATQTPLTAMRCVQLLHQAGIPTDVLHYLPGDGARVGQQLLTDNRVAGIAFTGSTATARAINRQLARDHQAIVPLIAETGGQNVMIADSSAHAEQLVQDVIQSAFNSAGQRCSALRVLFIQQDVAEGILEMLKGAISQLLIGDPDCLSTDMGPVINQQAVKQLTEHVNTMREQAKILFQLKLDKPLKKGNFFPPTLIELTSLQQLEQEVFGPVLHIIRYRSSELNQVIAAVNATGYGLTLGIHSRVKCTIQSIQRQVKVGNIYVNRNMIGAVVGVQPFGGMGLSGTGPKAGGPDYLRRFAVEQTLTTNTTAMGGNARLLARDLR